MLPWLFDSLASLVPSQQTSYPHGLPSVSIEAFYACKHAP